MLKPPFESGDRSEMRVQKMGQLFQQLQDLKFKKDSSVFQGEIEKLRSYANEIKQMFSLIESYKVLATQSLKKLEEQFSQLNIVKHSFEAQLSQLDKLHCLQKNQYDQLKNQYVFKKKQRVAIAQTINLKPLLSLEIEDRKSQCHQIFIWIIMVIYKETAGKYYWNNFKDQAFDSDNGEDFIQRMGKISATDLKQDQRVITQKLLASRSQIQKAPQFQQQGVIHEIKKFIQIARLILDGYELSKKSKELDKQDHKSHDQRILKEQNVNKIKAKINAVQDRKNLNIKYCKVLDNIEQKLKTKSQIYSDIEQDGYKVLRELKQLQSGNVDFNSASVHHELQRKQQKCLLF